MSKANIKYEKLMNICFSCGQLGHGSKDCVNGYVDTKNLKFGVCQSASPWKTIRDESKNNQTKDNPQSCQRKIFFTKMESVSDKEGG